MSWIGGKKSSRDIILPRIPQNHTKYIEVFGGAGWILFAKPQNGGIEVYNDANSNLSNLFTCVREHSNDLISLLRYVINSREDFNRIKEIAYQKATIGDVKRAAEFYQLIRYSYASGCDSYAAKPHSIWNDFPLIDIAAHRLQTVVVENKDFESLIKGYDSPTSFFYCDPPYFETESYYSNVSFTTADHERLKNTLTKVQGKFLLSYNDCKEIRELYDGYEMYSYQRINNIAQRYDAGNMFKELLIANYDMNETINSTHQISLYDMNEWF